MQIFKEIKDGRIRPFFYGKILALLRIRQKSTLERRRFHPNGLTRISRKPHTAKKGERGGRYALKRIRKGKSPIEKTRRVLKK